MSDRIAASLETIVLGGTATVQGVRVRRRSLLGFEVAGCADLLDAAEAAKKVRALAKCRPVRVAICSRCGGDGLGRRNRGACGLCHGPGIEIVPPPLGFRGASPEEAAVAIEQALAALDAARYPRARQSLVALLREALPSAPPDVRARAFLELRRRGLDAEPPASAPGSGGPEAA